jgi:hypothetical protein
MIKLWISSYSLIVKIMQPFTNAPMGDNNLPLRYLNEHFILTRPLCEFNIFLNNDGYKMECEGTLVVTT